MSFDVGTLYDVGAMGMRIGMSISNIGSEIKVPTVYEVRRALGIDNYVKSMKDASDVSAITGPGAKQGAAAQILAEIQAGLRNNGNTVTPTTSTDYSGSNNVVNVNGANFDQVVAWISQYLGAGAQVVRAISPRKG